MSCVGGGRELIHRCHIDNTGVVTVVRGVAAVVVESHTGPHLNSPLSIRFSLAWSRLRLVEVPLTRVVSTNLSSLHLQGEDSQLPQHVFARLREPGEFLCGIFRKIEGDFHRVPGLAFRNV